MNNNWVKSLCAMVIATQLSSSGNDMKDIEDINDLPNIGKIIRVSEQESYISEYIFYNSISNNIALINAHLLREQSNTNESPTNLQENNLKIEFALCSMERDYITNSSLNKVIDQISILAKLAEHYVSAIEQLNISEDDGRYPLYKRLKELNDVSLNNGLSDMDNRCNDILSEINRNKEFCRKRAVFMSYNKKINAGVNECNIL